MSLVRIIPRLDIKGPNVVKGLCFDGYRVLGHPETFAQTYYREGADELFFQDTVASLYKRNNLLEIVSRTAEKVMLPITVCGGIRTLDDIKVVLRSGGDKVAINTAAIKDPSIISSVARRFGSQCMVLSIQAKRQTDRWEAYFDNGREHSGLDVLEWAKTGQRMGAGEILLTSVDQEGTAEGFDIDLVKAVEEIVDIPIIASGGMGHLEDLDAVVFKAGADAVAMAHVLHYQKYSAYNYSNAVEHLVPDCYLKNIYSVIAN